MITLDSLNASLALMIQKTSANASILVEMTVILVSISVLNWLLGGRLFFLGLTPRTFHGAFGIIFSPFLHLNFDHLFFNLIPLLVLSNFLLMNGLDYFIHVTVMIGLLSGLLLWCFGKPAIHIGASGVITGFWALLVMNVFEQPSLIGIILAGISVYYFGGIFLGIFPSSKNVSWEGHLFGLVAGALVAYLGIH